jgi:hypothetical protein
MGNQMATPNAYVAGGWKSQEMENILLLVDDVATHTLLVERTVEGKTVF